VRLQLPLTLALIDGFYVRAADETFVIPLDAVSECLDVDAMQTGAQEPSGVISVRGEAVPYLRLRRLFGLDGAATRESVVVVHQQGRRAGLVVDALEGGAQAVLKPLGPLFRSVNGISGSTITGDGRVALVLDIAALLRRASPAPEKLASQ
jgi:two-component system chemotaxis sensor kinase CheA